MEPERPADCRSAVAATRQHLRAAVPRVMAWVARVACPARHSAPHMVASSCWRAGGRAWRPWAARSGQVQQPASSGTAQLCLTTCAPSSRQQPQRTSTGMAAAAAVPAGALGPRDFDGWFTEVEAMWKGESACGAATGAGEAPSI